MPSSNGFVVGVDIGGTFTDAVAVAPDGELFIGKVLTTPEDFSTGFFGAIAGAAAAAGWDERVLLGAATRVAHGTTVITDKQHIERGYTDVVAKLSQLGATISDQ